MKNIRLVHFYLGVFFAPLILFFAFTGILQVFKLHETYRQTPGSQGDWVAWFGQFHKEQAWIAPKVAPATPPKPKELQPMRWPVALMGVALIASTLLGLYMAFNYPRRRMQSVATFVAGCVVMLGMMAF